MRIAILTCCILALALLGLLGLSYAPGFAAEVSITAIDSGAIIQNAGGTPCLVIVNSLEGEQQFELAVGANVTLVTLSNITTPFNVRAFGSAIVRVDLEELEQLERAHEKWAKIKYDLSSKLSGL